MLVALAGPMSNFFLAIVFTLIISFLKNIIGVNIHNVFIIFFNVIVNINLALGVFNLVPVPPLDGSRIVAWILPLKLKEYYYKLEPYGVFILMLLMFTVGFSKIFRLADMLQFYLYTYLGIM